MNNDEEQDLRIHVALHAMGNPNLVTGQAPEWQLAKWFGGRGGIKASEIAAEQAVEYADALIARVRR